MTTEARHSLITKRGLRMPGYCTAGPLCQTTQPRADSGTNHRGRSASPSHIGSGANGQALQKSGLSVSADVDQSTGVKTVRFNRVISTIEASQFLFGNGQNAKLLKPIDAKAGQARSFVLDSREVAIIMSLRPEVRDQLVRGGMLRSNGKPYDFPKWLPEYIRADIRSDKLQKGVTRYASDDEWGDYVVWTGDWSVQIYREFPDAIEFYRRLSRDDQQARLLHFAYTSYNRDMHRFVDELGRSPEDARAEIRRINEELFKMIVEGAVAILSAGAGITAVSNAIRANADQVSNAARRSYRTSLSSEMKIKPVNGRVNVGGGDETSAGWTNLNPIKPGSGGPEQGIANHVKASMEEMDRVFEPGSVSEMISSKLRFVDVNWDIATKAAAKVMRPGGKVAMNVWCQGAAEQAALKNAFVRAGFKEITIKYEGVGTMLEAIR
jgi:hypothetical protein